MIRSTAHRVLRGLDPRARRRERQTRQGARDHVTLPLDMFDQLRTADEVAAAKKLEGIYHKGQRRAWNGKEVLAELVEKHGGVKVSPEQREALRALFAVILWGELAAWKISADLAQRLEPLEAKMAATAQAHDEARHFYVMHDYLHAIDAMPKEMDFWSRRVVELTLGVDDLAKKLYGMQLTIEVIALTIFQRVRELEVEPVLTELLPYYERDEARHVGLGTQLVPSLIQGMTPAQQLDFALFELDLLLSTLMGLKGMEPDLLSIGVDPRSILGVGFRKITEVNKVMKSEFPDFPDDPPITRIFHGVSELLFPQEGAGAAVPLPRRAKHAALVAARRMEGVIEIWSRRGRVDADPPIVHA